VEKRDKGKSYGILTPGRCKDCPLGIPYRECQKDAWDHRYKTMDLDWTRPGGSLLNGMRPDGGTNEIGTGEEMVKQLPREGVRKEASCGGAEGGGVRRK